MPDLRLFLVTNAGNTELPDLRLFLVTNFQTARLYAVSSYQRWQLLDLPELMSRRTSN
jgi:hypothetical protein